MAKWKAPGETPVIISRLDGHSIWVGSDPVEAPAFFEDELAALGAVRIDDILEPDFSLALESPEPAKRRGRKPKAVEPAAVEPAPETDPDDVNGTAG